MNSRAPLRPTAANNAALHLTLLTGIRLRRSEGGPLVRYLSLAFELPDNDRLRACHLVFMSPLHPAFGKLCNAEWDVFNLRHSEMHMSFARPNLEVVPGACI